MSLALLVMAVLLCAGAYALLLAAPLLDLPLPPLATGYKRREGGTEEEEEQEEENDQTQVCGW